MQVNSVYSLNEVFDLSRDFYDSHFVLNFILDTVSITVLILLSIILIAIGVVLFFLCRCSPRTTARSSDDHHYSYHISLRKLAEKDINSNRRNGKSHHREKVDRKLSLIVENNLDPLYCV
ncbi:hypothetical protein B9Z55_023756 [Caenorhabditis nigoni]|nr:hypothetical protein B9Z55_023756 [Caenorhabditis nigoni]